MLITKVASNITHTLPVRRVNQDQLPIVINFVLNGTEPVSEVKARLEYDKSAVNSIVTLLVGMACQVYPLKARPGRQKDNNTSLYVYV